MFTMTQFTNMYKGTKFVKVYPSKVSHYVVQCLCNYKHGVDREIFVIKKFFIDDLFRQKLNTQNILCNIRRPIPIFVAKVW